EAAALSGGRAQLAGCRVEPAADGFRIGRDGRALRTHSVPATGLFDGRWQLSGPPAPAGASLRALGAEGLRACPDWRARPLPPGAA
ncbi:MAG: tRNA(Ile)-lysidine synthetase, partial [Gemmobacter sp.]